MMEFLHWLFYLGILALVVGCFAYLFVTRDQNRVSRSSDGEPAPSFRASAKKAEALSGSYRLLDLESIFDQLAAIEAWGMVLELRFAAAQEDIQMIVNRNEVEFCAPSLDPRDTDLFRQSAREAGLQARTGYTEGQYCVDVIGTWPKIASMIRSIIGSIYGVGDSEEVQVRVFN
jgi:hypothetical protein